LDRWALLNIDMDNKAKEHWYRTQAAPAMGRQDRIFGEPWALWIGDRKMNHDIRAAITEHLHGRDITAYWDKRNRFQGGSAELIDWKATGKAMAAVSLTRQRWVTKHVSGFCGSRKMMHRWKKCAEPKCPRCDEIEDSHHVWKCQGMEVNEVWDKSMARVKEWMRKEKTQPSLAAVICDRLSAWRYGTEPIVNPSTFLGLRAATDNQEKVGWEALLEGAPAIGWREVQQAYLEWLGSRKTGERWLSALIQKLWDVAWDLWSHRNRILHDKDNNARITDQIQQIRDQFTAGRSGLTQDAKILFCQGMAKTIALSPAMQEAWLIRVIASRRRFLRRKAEQDRTYAHERQVLARWLSAR
jgi:hypothetical protein